MHLSPSANWAIASSYALWVDGFLYILARAFIRHTVVFSLAMLNATLRDNVNQITTKVCQSKRSQSSSFIDFGFVYTRSWYRFFLIHKVIYLNLLESKICTIKLLEFHLCLICGYYSHPNLVACLWYINHLNFLFMKDLIPRIFLNKILHLISSEEIKGEMD